MAPRPTTTTTSSGSSSSSSSGGFWSGLFSGFGQGATDIVIPSADARAAASAAAAAGGASLSSLNPLGGLGDAVQAGLDEAHQQEDFFLTLTRWGTVAIIAIVVLILGLLAAYFLAPARSAIGKLAG